MYPDPAADSVGPTSRPLPDKPNLEYERKRAKKLVRLVRSQDPEALKVAGPYLTSRRMAAADFRLADGQFVIAREYGFASWRKLRDYLVAWERRVAFYPYTNRSGRTEPENLARALFDAVRQKHPLAARLLATYLPRFYGCSDEEIFSAEPTLDELRLAVAREMGYSKWTDIPERPTSRDEVRDVPAYRAVAAIRAQDLPGLASIVDAHPELLQCPPPGEPPRVTLIDNALWHEIEDPRPDVVAVTDWLTARGADRQTALNRMLTYRVSPEELRALLARGADPSWIPPNGIPVLEHVLLVAKNPISADLIAKRVTPRRAFWIAAGLGDVAQTMSYFDRAGRLTSLARRHRPEGWATGAMLPLMPSRPGASDEEVVWEAFLVAAINERLGVLEALLGRGFPIDYAGSGYTILQMAIAWRMAPLVEFLVDRGANLDAKGWRYFTEESPRQLVEDLQNWDDFTSPAAQRIYRSVNSQRR